MPFGGAWIDFRNDQRNRILHSKGGTVIDDEATFFARRLNELPGNVRSGAEDCEIQSLEGFLLGFTDGFDVPANFVFPACGLFGSK